MIESGADLPMVAAILDAMELYEAVRNRNKLRLVWERVRIGLMAELTRSFIARLRADDPTLRKDLWRISDLLRKAWSQEYWSGFEEIDSEEISTEEALELRGALLDAYHRASNKTDSWGLLDTLARAYEESIKDDLVKQLHLALEMQRAASGLLWQTLRGLDDVGEQVWEPSENSLGLPYVEMNIRAADRYLQKRRILVPW